PGPPGPPAGSPPAPPGCRPTAAPGPGRRCRRWWPGSAAAPDGSGPRPTRTGARPAGWTRPGPGRPPGAPGPAPPSPPGGPGRSPPAAPRGPRRAAAAPRGRCGGRRRPGRRERDGGGSGGDGVGLQAQERRPARFDAADGDHDPKRLLGRPWLTPEPEARLVQEAVLLLAVAAPAGRDHV